MNVNVEAVFSLACSRFKVLIQHPNGGPQSDGDLWKKKTEDMDLAVPHLEAGGGGITKGEQQRKES